MIVQAAKEPEAIGQEAKIVHADPCREVFVLQFCKTAKKRLTDRRSPTQDYGIPMLNHENLRNFLSCKVVPKPSGKA